MNLAMSSATRVAERVAEVTVRDLGPDDHAWARQEAEKTFGQTVDVAREGATYDV